MNPWYFAKLSLPTRLNNEKVIFEITLYKYDQVLDHVLIMDEIWSNFIFKLFGFD